MGLISRVSSRTYRKSAMAQQNTAQLEAMLEQETMADLYNKMSFSCHAKCIDKGYKEAHLNKGETVCIDRCVAKYLETYQTLGAIFSKTTQENQKEIHEVQKVLAANK